MNRRAFTMIEMIISLGIVASIMMLTVPKTTRSYQEWQGNQFWRELKQEWQLSQVRSQNEGEITDITYSQEERAIVFCSKNHRRKIRVPGFIRVRDLKARTMLSNGYIRPATWSFIDLLHHEEIDLKIQMAGGGYRIERQRIYSQ